MYRIKTLLSILKYLYVKQTMIFNKYLSALALATGIEDDLIEIKM